MAGDSLATECWCMMNELTAQCPIHSECAVTAGFPRLPTSPQDLVVRIRCSSVGALLSSASMLTLQSKPLALQPPTGEASNANAGPLNPLKEGPEDFLGQQEETPLPARLATLPDPQLHGQFLQQSLELILRQAVFAGTDRKSKVVQWREPAELQRCLDLSLPPDGASHHTLLQLAEDVIRFSVKTGHPLFVNQLYGGLDPYGLVGQWLTDALNPSVYTFEVSPVFSLMEEQVLAEMRRMVGFQGGDGLFCPGGSIANGYGISCARHHACPDIKKLGLHAAGRLVMFTSEDAHYSMAKLGSFMGLGADNVIGVKTDHRGKMDPAALEEAILASIADGGKPFLVAATCGTTVVGAFDPLVPIAQVCRRYGLWLHVDAAWGGGCLMSRKRRHLLEGIHMADSVIWNPHKLLAAPQQCSVFLTRHKTVLQAAHAARATYLFQKDKFYDVSYDTGDKHIQCGRRADVLKFWFMWKAKGSKGFAQHIDKIFGLSEYFTSQISSRTGWEMVFPEPECTNVCFWYLPPSLRGMQHLPDFKERLHKVAPKIKERMIKEGSLMVTYQPLHDLPNFFRIVFINSGLETHDIDNMISIIERLGEDL